MNKNDIDILNESYKTSILLLEVQVNSANITRFCQKYHFVDDEIITKYINDFNKIQNKLPYDKKDLFGSGFTDIKDLKNTIDQFSQIQSKSQYKKQIKSEEADIIVNNDKWLIIRPLTYKASCLYGAGTKWCTSGEDTTYWEEYIMDDHSVLYYVIDKTKTKETDPINYKLSIEVDLNQNKKFWNAPNKKISENQFKQITGITDLTLFINDTKKYLNMPENYTKEELINFCIRILFLSQNEYKINKDLSLDVYVNVVLSDFKLEKLPVKFNYVKGNFYCDNNKLQTLKGSPQRVDGLFMCQNNKLQTLEYAPKYVGDDFEASNNPLKSKKLNSVVKGSISY